MEIHAVCTLMESMQEDCISFVEILLEFISFTDNLLKYMIFHGILPEALKDFFHEL